MLFLLTASAQCFLTFFALAVFDFPQGCLATRFSYASRSPGSDRSWERTPRGGMLSPVRKGDQVDPTPARKRRRETSCLTDLPDVHLDADAACLFEQTPIPRSFWIVLDFLDVRNTGDLGEEDIPNGMYTYMVVTGGNLAELRLFPITPQTRSARVGHTSLLTPRELIIMSQETSGDEEGVGGKVGGLSGWAIKGAGELVVENRRIKKWSNYSGHFKTETLSAEVMRRRFFDAKYVPPTGTTSETEHFKNRSQNPVEVLSGDPDTHVREQAALLLRQRREREERQRAAVIDPADI